MKSHPHPHTVRTRGFTLIELLVVITIIVILISMLVPSLEKSIYQAQLTVCGGNFKAIGIAVTEYAAGHKSHYPYRPQIHNVSYSEAGSLCAPGNDSRPYIRDYLSMKTFLDPFSNEYDIDAEGTPWIWQSSNLYYGFGYVFDTTGNGGQMFRLGERWSWAGREYKLLAIDASEVRTSRGQIRVAHPATGLNMEVLDTSNEKLSAWYNRTNAVRGEVDLNAVYVDGSVTRYTKVSTNDERMDIVPHRVNGTDLWDQVPRTQ